jgi:hypothetical protein
MTSKRISYADLAEKVGDCILFNNHNEFNDEWYYGIYEQPLMTKRLDEIDEENKQYALERIESSTDEAEKAKLKEEFEQIWDADNSYGYDRARVTDFEVYQTYHIPPQGAEYLFNHTAELISYCEKLDAYLWHIGHFGTSWTHVHTTLHEFEDGEYDSYVSLSEMDKYMNN